MSVFTAAVHMLSPPMIPRVPELKVNCHQGRGPGMSSGSGGSNSHQGVLLGAVCRFQPSVHAQSRTRGLIPCGMCLSYTGYSGQARLAVAKVFWDVRDRHGYLLQL